MQQESCSESNGSLVGLNHLTEPKKEEEMDLVIGVLVVVALVFAIMYLVQRT